MKPFLSLITLLFTSFLFSQETQSQFALSVSPDKQHPREVYNSKKFGDIGYQFFVTIYQTDSTDSKLEFHFGYNLNQLNDISIVADVQINSSNPKEYSFTKEKIVTNRKFYYKWVIKSRSNQILAQSKIQESIINPYR